MSDNTPSELDDLVRRIKACRICRDTPRGAALDHDPRPVLRVSTTARICICGQAPGTRVHASGLPFDDPSGDRLRSWLGVTRDEFYDSSKIAFVPMGFCFPGLDAKGGDKPPRRECAENWRKPLFDCLPEFELVLLVGHYAQRWHLGKAAKPTLTETVRHWRYYYDRPEHPYLPVPHPSWRNNVWLKRHPWFEAEILPFLQGRVRAALSTA